MERFVKGDVVVIPFPFSDLTGTKRRPALVLADLAGDDIILCQITSQQSEKDKYSIELDNNHFNVGELSIKSNIRPNRVFTADKNIIVKKVGSVKNEKIKQVIQAFYKIIGE